MIKNPIPRCPAHLSPEAKRLWKRLFAEWVIDEPGSVAILVSALESFDRCQAARRAIAEDGLSVKDRWGVPKVHPLAAVLRDAEASFRAGLRQLGIDKAPNESPPRGVGRPASMV